MPRHADAEYADIRILRWRLYRYIEGYMKWTVNATEARDRDDLINRIAVAAADIVPRQVV
jgi:hypothetical protein